MILSRNVDRIKHKNVQGWLALYGAFLRQEKKGDEFVSKASCSPALSASR